MYPGLLNLHLIELSRQAVGRRQPVPQETATDIHHWRFTKTKDLPKRINTRITVGWYVLYKLREGKTSSPPLADTATHSWSSPAAGRTILPPISLFKPFFTCLFCHCCGPPLLTQVNIIVSVAMTTAAGWSRFHWRGIIRRLLVLHPSISDSWFLFYQLIIYPEVLKGFLCEGDPSDMMPCL